ncbi:MAG: FAD-dependent oxidoreductase [Gammaproteobacteria bacterium]|nr:FAD-dependent oxidoreductase [Gammaproteobacteria bacterium]
MSYPTLFSPTTIGGVAVRNRVAHASIVSRFVHDGRATDRLVNYLGSRARGGAGLVITEPVAMTFANRSPQRLRGWDDAALDDLKRVAAAVERWDSRVLAQVQDPGRGRHATGRNEFAIGASALPDDLSWTVPHVLTPARIRQLIDEWAAGCRRLQGAGFSGVEISAGHGHLFHQFLSPWSNRRTDEYGGDVAGRTRFLTDLMAAIRAACGRPFIIGLKLPGFDGVPGSIDLAEAARIAAAVAATGNADYWTFVWGAHARSLWLHMPGPAGPRAPYLDQIRELRQADPAIPTGAIGYVTDPNEAERALTDGTADLVFLGRPLITDPAWGEKARTGREAEIRYCVSCNTCWRTVVEGTRLECDNNPRVGEPDEVDWQPARAAVTKDVAVIGSGIAGLEAAWVAAARGHRVTVYGTADEPGGKTRLHAEVPGGEHLSSIYDYQQLACRRHGVRFRMGTTVDAAMAAGIEADAVILATGSTMGVPPGIPAEFVTEGFVLDLRSLLVSLRGRTTKEPGRLVLLDQDHTEMTYGAALKLLDRFARLTIVTPRERIASDVPLLNRQSIYQQLYGRHVEILTNVEPRSLDGLEDGRLTVFNVYNGDPTELDDVAAVTYSTPRVPDDGLRAVFEAAGREVHLAGDCYAPRSVLAATRQGYAVGMAI